jgi:uncharacterized membrane protein YeaQ/YmgE (transglycosylase-associated protein family)
MWLIWWVIFGLVVGGIAKLLMPGRDPGGCIVTMLLGVAGSLLGGFLGRVIGLYGDEVSGAGFIMSILGAILLLVIYRFAFASRVRRTDL